MQHVPFVALAWVYLLIYLPRFGPVAAAMKQAPGGYNNSDPRLAQQQLEGAARRALNAHNNGFEAFAPFAAALLAAMWRAPERFDVVAYLAIGFAVLRTVYVFAYLANKASLRSAMWSLGMFSTCALFIIAIIG